ncbi:MAG: polymer-forming cytoskeletal protein [Rhodospirillales bacterium]|nr:polymer-forming cytoskeletal protein [Rhodospirillales bacterium]
MFRKKNGEEEKAKEDDDMSPPPLKPFSRKGSHVPSKPPSPTSYQPEPHQRRNVPDIPGLPQRRPERGMAGDADSKKLVIARDVCINGEITACDTLIVEGRAEASMPGAHILEVAPSGFFKCDAVVQEADISGRFEGELVARDRLVVRSGGRISGTIRYGRIVIESGGQISGDMQTLDGAEGVEPGTDNEEGAEAPSSSPSPSTPPVPSPPRRNRPRPKSRADKK